MKKPAVDNSVPFTVPLIEEARPADFGAVSELLAANKLPVEDLLPALPHFFVVREKPRVIAAIGMEVYGDAALLRSAVVDSAYRGHGLAAALLQHLLVAARQQGISVIYLLTTTAAPYFANKGFTTVTKDDVPSALLQSKEFNGLCPSTATIMFRRVE